METPRHVGHFKNIGDRLPVHTLGQVSAEALGYCKFDMFEHFEGPQICRYLSAHLHIKKRAQNLRIHSSKPADLLIFELSNHPFRMTSEVSGHTKGVVLAVVPEFTRHTSTDALKDSACHAKRAWRAELSSQVRLIFS